MNIEKHYFELLNKYGDSAAAVQYSSKESQFRRFAALTRIADLSGKRILDYGCGTAALMEYLTSVNQIPSLYQGVDIVPQFFDYAKNKFPSGKFCLPNELDDSKFDFVFISGVFNNIREDNRAFWQETIKSLFERCTQGIAFNLMSSYVDYRDPELFYEDPEHAFHFMKTQITPYVCINHDYLAKVNSVPFEFTIFGYHSDISLKVTSI